MSTEKTAIFKDGEEPRERLERLGVRALSDRELLMILLGQGNAARSVDEISNEVLSLLDRGTSFPLASLMNIPGVGRAKGATILAALELGRRKNTRKPRQILHPTDIFQEVRHYANRNSQEYLIVLSLNGAKEVLDITVATIGFVNRAFFHPREVFSEPLKKRATSIAIAHNHPSGLLVPSNEDRQVTRKIALSGEILGINLVDHVIFSDTAYYSFLEHREMDAIDRFVEGEVRSAGKREEAFLALEKIRSSENP